MKYFIAAASAFSAALLLCSCASSERMMRLSPFETRQTARYDDSTVNIWPMFYNNGAYSSAFWPMVDSDAKGFAVRPFYNQDGKEYSILFPLSAWNPEKHNGWVFNAYWNINNVGAFPLFHAGKDLNFYGPIWYMGSDKSFGFFPLYGQNSTANAWVFPLYLYNVKDQEQMVLPLFGTLGMYYTADDKYHYRAINWFHTGSKDFTNNSVLPIYYYQKDGEDKLLLTLLSYYTNDTINNKSATNVGGIMFINRDSKEKQYLSVMWPFYIQSFTPESTAYGSIPFFWYKNYPKEDKSSTYIMGPMFIDNKTKDEQYMCAMWPLYIKSTTPDSNAYGSIPFFWHENYPKKDKSSTYIMGPMFINNKDKSDQYVSAMWPLYIQSTTADSNAYGSIPFFWYKNYPKEDKTNLMIMGPMFINNRDKNNQYLSVMWPFYIQSFTPNSTAYGSIPFFWHKNYPKEDKSSTYVMGPMFINDRDPNNQYLSVMWPFYIQSFTPDSTAYGSIPFFWHKNYPKEDKTETTVMGPMFINNRDPNNQYLSVMWPLYIQSFTPESTAYGSIPFFWYKKYLKKDRTEMNVMWPLYSQNSIPAMVNNNDTNFNILGPLIYMNSHSLPNQNKEYGYDYEYDNYYFSLLFDYKIENHAKKLMPQYVMDNKNNRRQISSSLFHFLFFIEYGSKTYNTWNSTPKALAELNDKLTTIERNAASLKRLDDSKDNPKKQIAKLEKENTALKNKVTALLQELKIEAATPGTAEEISALQNKLYERYCQKVIQHNYGFPLIFDYETFGEDYKWNVFFFLTRGSLEGQQEKFRVLEYFYRYQRDGDETSRAIFPFISYKTAPDRSKFAFLWRVYRSETDHGKTSGHIMFIPFGETKK